MLFLQRLYQCTCHSTGFPGSMFRPACSLPEDRAVHHPRCPWPSTASGLLVKLAIYVDTRESQVPRPEQGYGRSCLDRMPSLGQDWA